MRIPSSQASGVPDWARQAVFYHIYPLGFLNAPHANTGQGAAVYRLSEISRWFDHITNLGVTAIYFGPLFESHTHGYDTVDYFQIDRRLGDNGLFREIVEELHQRNIRVILDGTFNHTGRGFFAFKDLQENKRASAYKDWYYVNWGADSAYGDGFAYKSWQGYESLPTLNTENPEVRQYIFEVARMWLSDMQIDGWRLDVAHELSQDFWWEFRRVCKKANPDAFLLGELIDGDYRTWVAPDLLDSGTDYQLYNALWRSFNNADLSVLKTALERAYHSEWGIFKDLALFNFLSNHDVTRILSLLEDTRHFYPALILLMTMPGIPSLYYGDEVGMTGHKEDGDAALRRPMPPPDAEWPDHEHAVYRQVARMTAIHKNHPALVYGRFAALEAEHTLFSFMRQHVRETAVIVINSGDQPVARQISIGQEGIPDGVRFRDVLDDKGAEFVVENGSLTIDRVWPGWGRILIADR